MSATVEVSGLTYEYPGIRALDNVSFSLKPGAITALVGPNGAGKTTLMRCLSALDSPLSGTITINGEDVSENPRAIRRQTGYLSDFFGLYDELSIYRCLLFIAWSRALTGSEAEEAVERVIKLCGLEKYRNHPAGGLSRGWRQRLGIAQAVIHRPSLLILDEPASGLDPEARQGLSELMRYLRDEGTTILVSSHILSELEDYCTEMVILRQGRVVEVRDTQGAHTEESTVELQMFRALTAEETASLRALPEVMQLTEGKGEGERLLYRLTVKDGSPEALHRLLKTLLAHSLPIIGYWRRERRLQDIYLEHANHQNQQAYGKSVGSQSAGSQNEGV
jgi:ABC-2 type transport system ATP-binding protein